MCRNLTLPVMHFQDDLAQMTGVDLSKVYSYNIWQRRKLGFMSKVGVRL